MTPEPDFTWREWVAVVVILVADFISGLIACDMLQPRCAAAAEEKLPAYLTSMDDACVGDYTIPSERFARCFSRMYNALYNAGRDVQEIVHIYGVLGELQKQVNELSRHVAALRVREALREQREGTP